jgi:subtilisin family serine protease
LGLCDRSVAEGIQKMNSRWMRPRWFRGQKGSLRRDAGASNVHPVVEVLEQRLALSTTAQPSLSLTYAQWRQMRFSIDDATTASQPVSASMLHAEWMEGSQQIGLDQVFAAYPYRGQSYTVAIIDTGIDYNNPALGGGWGRRVVAGWNFVNNTSNVMDDNGHGTAVAGIIGSSDARYTGIAPDVHFVALKVLDATGSGTFGAVQDALNWVVAHQQQYNIVAVNMSLGSGDFAVNPYTFLDSDFTTLVNDGVFISVAAGNDYYPNHSQQGLAFPAIDPNVVSVGAVWDGNYGTVRWLDGAIDYNTAPDHITSFTERGPGLDLLAPGAMMTSTYLGNQFVSLAGTSMAAPVVAGAAVLLHQELVATGHAAMANQSSMLSLMQSTGITIHDGNYGYDNVAHTGMDFKRLDLSAAMAAINGTNTPPVLAAITDQTGHAGQTLAVNLVASDPDGDALTFSARAFSNAQTQSGAVPVTLSISGTQLLITPAAGFSGTFYVSVTASDGQATTSRSFKVTVANTAPTLAAIPNQTMAAGGSLTLILHGSDPDNDPLTYSAQVIGAGNPQAYQLKQQLGLTYLGTYYFNIWGQKEKWLAGRNNQWYFILPSGELRRWSGTLAGSLAPSSLVARLAPSFYANPSLLWNAQPGSAPDVSLKIQGNQLVIQAPANYSGAFTVRVSVTDGQATATTTFTVTVKKETAPSLSAIPNQTMKSGTSLALRLSGSDADGDTLAYSAQVQTGSGTASSEAYQLKQQLGLTYAGSYYTNTWGLNEKWLAGANHQWYLVLPDGELRHWTGTLAGTLSANGLIARLAPSFYADPSRLWNAQPGSSGITVKVNGNQLMIQAAAGVTGSFQIQVTVSDGTLTATRTFTVNVTN